MIRRPHTAATLGTFRAGTRLWSGLFALLATASSPASCALAQTVASAPLPIASGAKTPAPVVTKAPALPVAKPAWQDLTSQQQIALRPLAANWAALPEASKLKWIAISKNYKSLTATEQTKMHSRMAEWVSLSQRERSQARLQYARTKQLSPAEKAATWQAYQALSPEERQKLAAKDPSKPTGAATAVKPVPPQKLAVVPMTRKTPNRSTKIAVARDAVDQKTLLPRPQPASEPTIVESH